LYAPDGTQASLVAGGKHLGHQTATDFAPAQWKTAADFLFGKSLVLELALAGEKRILEKRLLRPLGK
ncbi:MAG: hypothetical protein IJJ33_19810, partial [Victivallales bacterium]|nr:hypothetical protein [Victivallales bacterium]